MFFSEVEQRFLLLFLEKEKGYQLALLLKGQMVISEAMG
jgi:hypothetical protein